MNPRNPFVELKRRDVYSVAVAYGVIGWLLIQQVFPFFDRKTPFCGIWRNEKRPSIFRTNSCAKSRFARSHEKKKLKHAIAELLRKGWLRTDGDAANCQSH